ncbi:MAG TPA: alpha-ketoglutarate-dependent dioxygenase AlkB [Stellaceae bacterium]|nr:alpha-ketoglutarate-dependent dioxygenase AlkB [Stellaceae bacterium]
MTLLAGRAGPEALAEALSVIEKAPPRSYTTPWGKRMSVQMTSCGRYGWYSDSSGYRYTETDLERGGRWPPMPPALRHLAGEAAAAAGFARFEPEACLINVYGPGAKMGLHQDRDEADFGQPVVSVSFGRDGRFRLGGRRRSDPTRTLVLHHGDVLVFGGPARLMYHGLDRLDGPTHPVVGDRRINLTFRRVEAVH